ncbi:MAG: hypothetical protein Tsb005_21440 [Gammaproteobacteria bacterium]
MIRKLRKYTKECKQEAINLALKSSSIDKTAKELGIPAATLHGWINLEFKQSLQHDINNHNFRSAMNEITATSWFFFRTAI